MKATKYFLPHILMISMNNFLTLNQLHNLQGAVKTENARLLARKKIIKNFKTVGAPGWLSWLRLQLLISAQVRSQGCEIESGSMLSRESAQDSLSLPLRPPPTLSCSHSLSLK